MKKHLFFLLFLFLFLPSQIKASTSDQFITIVNPVRIARYTTNPAESLKAQYEVVKQFNLPATWLVSFDALSDNALINETKKFDPLQEIGVLLEVSPQLASASAVPYHQTGSWHFASSVFLSGYTQDERIRLIDQMFKRFKSVFGHYPVSVGSWWTDSFSLSYVKTKYGVIANLGCADQFSTDNYQLWGQYWSVPYYPSRYHTGLPASSTDSKLGVVNLQWAAREPDRGYKSSLFSTQDYQTQSLQIDYFKSLIETYAKKHSNKFGQITVGLEGDLAPDTYSKAFKEQLSLVSVLRNSGEYQTTTMSQFANWYMQSFPELSPPHTVTFGAATWYQSPYYRVGSIDGKIVDLRIYPKDFTEPYYLSPNREITLHINTPSIFDSISDKSNLWDLSGAKFEFFSDKFIIHGQAIDIPVVLSRHPGVKISSKSDELTISINTNWSIPKEGIIFSDWSAPTLHLFKSPRALARALVGMEWSKFTKEDYYVSPEELVALQKLSTLPAGKVMVSNAECLQCAWHSKAKPPVFANRRVYIKKYGQHPLIYDSLISNPPPRQDIKSYIRSKGAQYMYLVKSEDYQERIPYSPGDLGVEMLYENAASQIWVVK